MQFDDTYKVTIVCGNCSYRQEKLVPKRTSVKAYMRETRCVNCECFLSGHMLPKPRIGTGA